MFIYFGYGSNINLASLKAKGVTPVASERGVLPGWRLRFNVQHWFHHEGGVGNIEPSTNPNDFVEGMVHTCHETDLAALDAVESYGLGYDRIEVDVETSRGIVSVQTYIGLPGFLDNTCLPTQRYLNIIIKGAEEAGLSPFYIDKLRKNPVLPETNFPAFIPPPGQWPHFNEQTLALHPEFTALGFAVFDMQQARGKLQGIIGLLGGKDMTLFFVKRHDTSSGNETDADIKSGNISDGAKEYLNAYMNEFMNEYKYVGIYDPYRPIK
ncbi:gamma-glutamylcyclotransferase family protein [Spirosoma sp.]|uniref:gamma-glutamylcyclotransferase family protein n=1 Tax=Spirosoma sp. TaxID=1899569 RepID=UPI0026089955|nr:gamma-glutamylcyclotransferase family protein [Spirosoma sp.]MCX6214754.1 gamma-glutamylcyclotransferase [Spirosoma sp.]